MTFVCMYLAAIYIELFTFSNGAESTCSGTKPATPAQCPRHDQGLTDPEKRARVQLEQ